MLGFVLQYFPRSSISSPSSSTHSGRDSVTFGVAGTLALIWGALGVFGAVTTAVNYAWGVEKTRSFWKHKLFSFVMLIVAGPLLLVALLLVSATQVVGASWFAGVSLRFPGLMVLRSLAVRIRDDAAVHSRGRAGVLLRAERQGAISRRVDRRVRHRAAVEGRARGFSWYMRDMSRFTRVNGSIAAVVVFLVWVYLQAVILLYGVEFTAAYARLRRGRPDEVPAAPAPRVVSRSTVHLHAT